MYRFALRAGHLVTAIALAVGSLGASPQQVAAADQAQLIPLHTWYSPKRGDHFSTSNPTWTPATGTQRSPDYGFVGLQGYVLDPAEPQPPDTVPLYAWYSASRGDNFVTSNPAWAGRPGDIRSPDYSFVRIEGYVFTRRLMGTVPLFSWYSPNRADNFATTNPFWSGAARDVRSPDYGFVRLEGYAYRSEFSDFRAFGYGSMRAAGTSARGQRPLLTMMLTFSDRGFRSGHTRNSIESLLFGGSGVPSANAYLDEVSGGAFGYLNAGTYTFQPLNDPGTSVNESTYIESCVSGECSNRSSSDIYKLGARAIHVAAARGVNFARFDADRNGRVDNGELAMLGWHAAPMTNVGGANRNTNPGCVRPAGQAVDVCIDIAWAAEGASFTTIVHELSHSLGTTDIYGSANHNDRYSLMASTIVPWEDDRGSVHFDPWHKMALGWVAPRIIEMRQPGDCQPVASPSRTSRTWLSRPVLFFDYTRGPREFFLVEFRNSQVSGTSRYDDLLPGSAGFAIWQTRIGADGVPAIIAGLRIGAGMDGILQSTIATGSDDVYERNARGVRTGIFGGDDRILQSGLAGDDVRFSDRANNIVAPPGWKRGIGPLVTSATSARPQWLDRSGSVLTLDISQVGTTSTIDFLDWNLGSTAPRIDSLHSTLSDGLVVLKGKFGNTRWTDIEMTHKDQVVRFGAASRSCEQIEVIPPFKLNSGTWTLVAYDRERPSLRSNAVVVEVQ